MLSSSVWPAIFALATASSGNSQRQYQQQVPPSPAVSLTAFCKHFQLTNQYLMLLRETILADSLWEDPELPRWEELACLRSLLATTNSPVSQEKRGTAIYMPFGTPWSVGAAATFERLVVENKRPDLLEPAVWATTLALQDKRPPPWDVVDAIGAQVLRAIRAGDQRSSLLEACPKFMLAVSDTGSARECLRVGAKPAGVLPTVKALPTTLSMVTQVHRLWDPYTLKPMALVTFRVQQHVEDPPKWLTGIEPSGMSRFDCVYSAYDPMAGMNGGKGRSGLKKTDHSIHNCYPPRPPIVQTVTMTAWDYTQEQWQESSSPGTVVSTVTSGPADPASAGFRFFSIPAGGASWSLSFRATVPAVGGRFGVDKLVPKDSSALFLSDLVLGSPTGGLRVPVGMDTIWTLPGQTISQRSDLFLYFQIGSDRVRSGGVCSLRISPDHAQSSAAAGGVRFDFAAPVVVGINAIQKGIGITALQPGSYTLEVTVRDTVSATTASGHTTLVIR